MRYMRLEEKNLQAKSFKSLKEEFRYLYDFFSTYFFFLQKNIVTKHQDNYLHQKEG